MTNFCASIICCALVFGQLIFYYFNHSRETINATAELSLLGWVTGFFIAIVGLILPNMSENFRRLYYWGKTICGIVLAFQVVFTLVIFQGCAKGLSQLM